MGRWYLLGRAPDRGVDGLARLTASRASFRDGNRAIVGLWEGRRRWCSSTTRCSRCSTSGRPRPAVHASDLIREAIEQYYKEDIEAAIDRAMVEGYTRVPDDDEFDGLAETNIRIINEDDPGEPGRGLVGR